MRPPGRHGMRRPARPVTCRAEGAAGHRGGRDRPPGGARPTSAPSDNGRADRRQRPAVRPEDADAGRRDRRRRPGRETAPSGRAHGPAGSRPGWDAGSGPRQCRGGPDPARPARGGIPAPGAASSGRRAVSGRQCVPAGAGGAGDRHAAAAGRARAGAAVPAERRGGWPWRTLLAAAGGLVLVLAFPGYDLPALAVLGPAGARPRRPRAAAARPACGSASSSGWPSSSRCCPGPASTSAPSRGWPWPAGRRCTWRCSAAPRR